jgi:hypothetical protein
MEMLKYVELNDESRSCFGYLHTLILLEERFDRKVLETVGDRADFADEHLKRNAAGCRKQKVNKGKKRELKGYLQLTIINFNS